MFFVIERLKEINFELSESQPDTEKDGNCAIWVLLDQMSYDFKWKSTAKSSNVASMRKQIISSLKSLVLKKKIMWSNITEMSYGSIQEYIERMSKSGEFCDEMFLKIASELFQRPVIIYPVFKPHRTGALGVAGDRTTIYPSSGSTENPFYFLYFSEAKFHVPTTNLFDLLHKFKMILLLPLLT